MVAAGIVSWPAETAAAYRSAGVWRGDNLSDAIWDQAARTPDRTVVADGEVLLSWSALIGRSETVATRLRESGLAPGARAVVQADNSWRFVPLLLGCLRAGVVPVMALTDHGSRELRHLVATTGARALVVTPVVRGVDQLARAHALGDAGEVELVVDLDALTGPGSPPGEPPAPTARGEDPAVMLLSGGTGGLPKPICRTHDDYAYNARVAAEVCEVGPDTVYLATLPLGHNFPLACPGVLGVLGVGGRVVVSSSTRPDTAFAAIARHGVTMTAVVPTVAQRWLEHARADPAHRAALRSLRLLQVGGSRLSDTLAGQVPGVLGCRLQQVFGMAEGLINMTRLDDPDEVVRATQGRPMSPLDEIRVVDPEDRPVPAGRPGALLTRGPYTPRGYVNAEAYNASAFTPDGWFRTGDVVRCRHDGNLVVEGRDKDIINRGGEKISAEDVENLAYACPDVLHAAAVGVADPDLGERLCLVVVPSPGRRVTMEGIHAVMVRQGAARTKLPERLEVLPRLPLTGVGKIDKKRLREQLSVTRTTTKEMSA